MARSPLPRLSSLRTRLLLASCSAFAWSCGPAAPNAVPDTPVDVDATWIGTHVEALAHDSMRGRDTGDIGYQKARDYVVDRMRALGLEAPWDGAHLQPVALLEAVADRGSTLEVGSAAAAHPAVLVAPDWLGAEPVVEGQGIYLGHAVPAGRDLAEFDLDGAVAFVLAGTPAGREDEPDVALRERAEVELALGAGATAVIVLDTMASEDAWASRAAPRRPTRVLADGTAPTFRPDAVVGPTTARAWLAEWAVALGGEAPEPGQRVGQVRLRRAHSVQAAQSWNVGGVLRGSDADVADEVVVFTAHLDHVGVGTPDADGDSIYNGAHDNALGVAKVLAAAQALMANPPRRSVLFLAVGAEESGLLGTWHYLHDPVFPLERTVASINHDGGLMGRRHDDVLSWGPEFSSIESDVEWAAETAGLRYNRERIPPFTPSAGLLHRSDHYPFLISGIPVAYLMPGFSRDGDPAGGQQAWFEYLAGTHHAQADNVDPKATYGSAVALTEMSVHLARRLANADVMPVTHSDAPIARTRVRPDRRFFRNVP